MVVVRHPPARPAWQAERRLVADLKKGRPEALAAFVKDPGLALYRVARAAAADEEAARQLYVNGLGRALARSAFRQEDQELCGWLAGQLLITLCREEAAATAGQLETDPEPRGGAGRRRGRGRPGRRAERTPGRDSEAADAGTALTPPPSGPARDWSPSLAEPATRDVLRAALEKAGCGLPVDLRHAWLLADVAGVGAGPAATALELSEGGLLTRLHQARLRLRAALEKAAPLPAAAGAEPASAETEACAEAMQRVRAWADGELAQDGAAELAGHMEACSGCRGLARSYRATCELAAELAAEALPPADLDALTGAALELARGAQATDPGEASQEAGDPAPGGS